ncbi:spermidine synthase, partial [Kaarinaea lacus]
MALLWSEQSGGTRYEVRTAGNSLRLYTDGVFHSQYNPTNPITGSVWDLLFLPAFFYPPQRIKRVLVLGVGGGAVMRQLLHFVDPDEIVGVELNATHLMLAKKYFGLRRKKITLIEDDAVQWMRHYRGDKFDMIIDDVFAEQDGSP